MDDSFFVHNYTHLTQASKYLFAFWHLSAWLTTDTVRPRCSADRADEFERGKSKREQKVSRKTSEQYAPRDYGDSRQADREVSEGFEKIRAPWGNLSRRRKEKRPEMLGIRQKGRKRTSLGFWSVFSRLKYMNAVPHKSWTMENKILPVCTKGSTRLKALGSLWDVSYWKGDLW